jgi:hypothetical protein
MKFVFNFTYMKRKGFYIKKSDKRLYLNIFKPDFIQYINDQPGEWVKFSIYEKLNDPKGFTHNMELIKQIEKPTNSVE